MAAAIAHDDANSNDVTETSAECRDASMYLRALLTDLFLLNDIVTTHMGTAVATQ